MFFSSKFENWIRKLQKFFLLPEIIDRFPTVCWLFIKIQGSVSVFKSNHLLFLRKENSTIEQLKCKDHEKRDQLLFLQMDLNYQISQRNEKIAYWAVCASWVICSKKSVNHKFF